MSSWMRTQNILRYEKPEVLTTTPETDVEKRDVGKRDLVNMEYTIPKCKDTVVLMVFFNPTGSFRIFQNLLYVKQQLADASIPLFIGELAYNDAPHRMSGPGTFQFRSSSYMFSKENLLNTMLAKDELKAFSKYVIMDCDVVFDAHDWVDGISAALETYDVIQPYQYANQLNLKFKSDVVKTSIAYEPNVGHQGYVWAFRRDWFDRVGGLYEYALIGGGDKCLAHMLGLSKNISNVYKHDIRSLDGSEKTSYLPYTIWHLHHGQHDKRRYIERLDTISSAMAVLQINYLRNAVDRGTDGIFEWKPSFKTYLNSVMFNYFKSRDDDG